MEHLRNYNIANDSEPTTKTNKRQIPRLKYIKNNYSTYSLNNFSLNDQINNVEDKHTKMGV